MRSSAWALPHWGHSRRGAGSSGPVDSDQRLGVLPSLFPMHTFYWGDRHTSKAVGPVLGRNSSPTGWVPTRGMIFTSHHDAPVTFPDSRRVLDATVTRVARGSGKVIAPDQCVDVITALEAMTIWPAWQHHEEKTKGSIEVGKLVDVVILSRDPTPGDPNTIDRITVTETIQEGGTVLKRTAPEPRKADLMPEPDRGGEDAFARFLRAAAAQREFAALPASRQQPAVRQRLANASHDASCVAPVLHDLAVAIAGGHRDVVR